VQHWFYVSNDQAVGPKNTAEIQHLLNAGAIDHNTLVWRPGLDDWFALKQFRELTGASSEGAGPPPLPPEVATPAYRHTQTSTMAIVAVCVAGIGLLCFAPLSVIGLPLGIIALIDINRSQGRVEGKPLAIIAIVIGAAALLLAIAIVLVIVFGAVSVMPGHAFP